MCSRSHTQLPHFFSTCCCCCLFPSSVRSFDFIFICLFVVFIVFNINVHLIHTPRPRCHGCAYCVCHLVRHMVIANMRYLYHTILVSRFGRVSSSRKRFRFHQVHRTQRRLQLLVSPRFLLFAASLRSPDASFAANKILSRGMIDPYQFCLSLHRLNCQRYTMCSRFSRAPFIRWNIL